MKKNYSPPMCVHSNKQRTREVLCVDVVATAAAAAAEEREMFFGISHTLNFMKMMTMAKIFVQ